MLAWLGDPYRLARELGRPPPAWGPIGARRNGLPALVSGRRPKADAGGHANGERTMAMTMSGEVQLAATRETVWQKLNDPEVLKICIPGCETLDMLSPTEFQ